MRRCELSKSRFINMGACVVLFRDQVWQNKCYVRFLYECWLYIPLFKPGRTGHWLELSCLWMPPNISKRTYFVAARLVGTLPKRVWTPHPSYLEPRPLGMERQLADLLVCIFIKFKLIGTKPASKADRFGLKEGFVIFRKNGTQFVSILSVHCKSAPRKWNYCSEHAILKSVNQSVWHHSLSPYHLAANVEMKMMLIGWDPEIEVPLFDLYIIQLIWYQIQFIWMCFC